MKNLPRWMTARDETREHVALLVPGRPSTITSQSKGISWRAHTVFTKPAVEKEGRRIRNELLIWDDVRKGYVPPTYPRTPYTGPVACQLLMVHPLTLLQAQEHADKLSDLDFTLRHTSKPDVDNSAKLVLDCLTKLQFWEDDSQVDDLRLWKCHGTQPCIRIWLTDNA